MIFRRFPQLVIFVCLIFLGLVFTRFQSNLIRQWQNSSGSLTEIANNLVSVQADLPSEYEGFGIGGVYCQDPGKARIPIPGAVVSFDGPHSVPAALGLNIPNPISPQRVTTINNGSFTSGGIADSIGVSVSTLWQALKLGYWKPNIRFVSLPQTLPAAITNPNFRSQIPTAQFCANGALGLCQNSNLCGGGNTFYQSCDMSGLTDQQGLERLGGFVFLFTNCTITATATPTPTQPPTAAECGQPCPNNLCRDGAICTKIEGKADYCTKPNLGNTGACQGNPNYQNCCVTPTIVPACLSAKMMVRSGTSWVNYNPQTHTIRVGDTVRFSTTGQSTTLTSAKFRLERDGGNSPIIVNSATRTVSGNNVTFTADHVITTGTEYKVVAELYR